MALRAFLALLILSRVASAQSTRVDVQGGVVITEAPPAHDTLPGIALGVRYFRAHPWLSGNLAVEPALDLSNPERGDLIIALTAGLGIGGFVDLGSHVTLLGGVRVDGVTASDWPGATQRAFGARFGPTASVLITFSHPWGHAMGLEVRAAWFRYEMDRGDSPTLGHVGLLVHGVLFPEPRRRTGSAAASGT